MSDPEKTPPPAEPQGSTPAAPPQPPATPAPTAKAKPATAAQRLSLERQRQARRRVLHTVLLCGGVLGAAMSGWLPLAYAQRQRLRPPGALDEKDFLASCIKCGQCVQVCPVQAIKLADLVDGFG
ncbi:MAG TPA: 4Fe-4S binding protein, partial [Burkholderiaceae bacterium]|nr:4Fe-4S binding protein [Burkholderiaceae bacterium]